MAKDLSQMRLGDIEQMIISVFKHYFTEREKKKSVNKQMLHEQ